MLDKASKNALHKRAIAVGLSTSVAAHLVVLAVVTIPAPDTGAGEGEADRIVMEPLEGIEWIDVAPVDLPELTHEAVEVPDEVSTADAEGAIAPESAAASTDFDQLLSELGQVAFTAEVPSTSRPVVTFGDLEPVTNTASVMASIAIQQGLLGEDEEGDIEGLLGRLSASLSGGGHCPTPGSVGPMILR